jgi:RNA 2',3'-cyclic 3'-phosphodiesterase
MPRLFTGLELPPDIALQLSMYRGGLGAARWVEPADYHITLRFLGDVDGPTANDAYRFLSDIARRPVSVTLTHLDTFGGDKPRAILAKVAPTRELSELQADHERLMRRLGLPPETRKFTPHVTLARLKDASPLAVADYLSARPMLRSMTFTAKRFALYSSRDSVGGGPYVVEAVYPLEERRIRAI